MLFLEVNWSQSLQTLVYGITIVVAVLFILLIAVKIMEAVNKPRPKKVVEKLDQPKNLLDSNSEDDQKICAVISAAVYMMLSEDDNMANNLSFKVRSIKRI